MKVKIKQVDGEWRARVPIDRSYSDGTQVHIGDRYRSDALSHERRDQAKGGTMTPADACALLERHRGTWPEWMEAVYTEWPGYPTIVIACTDGRRTLWLQIKVQRDVKGFRWARTALVRPGLPDEENVRRILDAAEKSYRPRQQQAEKKRQRKPMKRVPLKGRATAKQIREAVGVTARDQKAAQKALGRARIQPINRKRKAKRFEEDFGGKERVEWGQARRCDTCGAPPPSQNSHILTRGSRLGKAREMISQCDDCHRKTERGAFSERRLLHAAAMAYQAWLDQGGHELPSGLERHGEAR